MRKPIALAAAALALALPPAAGARAPAWYGPWKHWLLHHKQGARPKTPLPVPRWAWRALRADIKVAKRPASSTAKPSAGALNASEQALASAVAGARASGGLPALAIDANLERAARDHAQSLLASGAFTHDFLEGGTAYAFATWIRRYTSGCTGENLAEGRPALSASTAVRMWLGSPGHRANLFSPSYSTMGVALSSANGRTIAVNVFGGC